MSNDLNEIDFATDIYVKNNDLTDKTFGKFSMFANKLPSYTSILTTLKNVRHIFTSIDQWGAIFPAEIIELTRLEKNKNDTTGWPDEKIQKYINELPTQKYINENLYYREVYWQLTEDRGAFDFGTSEYAYSKGIKIKNRDHYEMYYKIKSNNYPALQRLINDEDIKYSVHMLCATFPKGLGLNKNIQ